ncbi:MAG: acetolactate synthase small subunit [Myxococcales bacterium]|nr:acetolactate synthase small subunit [Myxococcales bacterium]MCB9519499.1 acetolactate synthase small subunit [Myxococcales bacterium]MCB9532099.1 acetolactate synthase small subunit [Myxococcales bacterium]MCB9533276.1 acetolactate synthase small subunit [Myxococcales bacterium]
MNAPAETTHTISLNLHNRPGVLNRVALVFARRGWNIDGLAVSEAHDGRFARCTVSARGDAHVLHIIMAQLRKLVDVVSAAEHSEDDSIGVELALVKVRMPDGALALDVTRIPAAVSCTIVDTSPGTLTAQLVGSAADVEAAHRALDLAHGVVEIVRTGTVRIARGDAET